MKSQTDLARQAEKYIIKHDLCQHSETILVGVSGGPDSLCLLDILISLQSVFNLNLHIVHLNHQLRGEESDSDARFVADLAKRLGIDCTIENHDVKEYQSHHKCTLEEAARELRYAFFSRIAESIGADHVAVGHNADDQAETIIMHLVRGTGLCGLKGMSPGMQMQIEGVGSISVIRPLLEVRRREIEEYCITRQLQPRYDSSNWSDDYLRNRIRSEIMPKLEEYNPAIVEGLIRMSRLVDEDINYIDQEVELVLESIIGYFSDGIIIDNDLFNALPMALKRRTLRVALGRLMGNLKDMEMVHIESVIGVISDPAGKKLSLPSGLTLYGNYDNTCICRGENPLFNLPSLEGETALQIPGETYILGWKITTEVLLEPPPISEAGGFMGLFDLDMTGERLTVRSRKEGDRFQPLGMENSKKLQDFMVDEKIPRVWRDNIPLVCSGQHIIWVVGWRIDHRTRVSVHTQRTLRIVFERE